MKRNQKEDEDDYNERLKRWFKEAKVPATELVPAMTDLSYLMNTWSIDITDTPEIVSLFITHKEEQLPWKILRNLAKLYRSTETKRVPDIYPAFALYFEGKFPEERRSYSNILNANCIKIVRKDFLEGHLDKKLSQYHQVYHRNLPDDADHLEALEMGSETEDRPSEIVPRKSYGVRISTPTPTRSATKTLKRKLPHDFATPPADKVAKPQMIYQGNHHKKSFESIVRLDAAFALSRAQLEIERHQTFTKIEQRRAALCQEVLDLDDWYVEEKRLLSLVEEKKRQELEDSDIAFIESTYG